MTRSVLCIGLVAVAASHLDGGALATVLDRASRDAAASAGRACLGSRDCMDLGAGLLSAGPSSAAALAKAGPRSVAPAVASPHDAPRLRPDRAAPHRTAEPALATPRAASQAPGRA